MRYSLLISFLLSGLYLFAAPGTTSQNIKVDQFGYRLNAKKVCVIANPQIGYNTASTFTPGTTYQVRKWADDVVVFTGSPVVWNAGATHAQSGDKVWWFDFSAVAIAGDYYIFDVTRNVGSYKFTIRDDSYLSILKAATKVFYYQRCGQNIDVAHGASWTHPICHEGAGQDLACRFVSDQTNAATAKDLSGGWHDAGDYNKYVNFTYVPMHNLLFAYQENPTIFTDDIGIPESFNFIPDVLDEVKYELDWLLKMQRADGAVYSKVSVTAYQAASPPSSDVANRYYGDVSTSATLTAAGIFAHAAIVYKSLGVSAMTTYGNTLQAKAIAAYTWAAANPTVVYTNAGFSSANPEVDAYGTTTLKTTAAALLYAATGTASYKTDFESTYTAVHCMAWTFWYSFEGTTQDIMIYYTDLTGVTPAVSTAIKTSLKNSMDGNNGDMLLAYNAKTDAYRAHIKDGDYTWGSNQVKGETAQMYLNAAKYGVNTTNSAVYKTAAEEYMHYFHGVNPNTYTYLTNCASLGAENSVKSMYHAWMGDGTTFDLNPAPGYLMGGADKDFTTDPSFTTLLSPPSGQPIQKMYLDWNTSWPQNSWQITEPAIYYQSVYVRLAANHTSLLASPVPLDLVAFNAEKDKDAVVLDWTTVNEKNTSHFEVERTGSLSGNWSLIDKVSAAGYSSSKLTYSDLDAHPLNGVNYYRLKMVDRDNQFTYSGIRAVDMSHGIAFSVYPNPAKDELHVDYNNIIDGNGLIEMFDQLGRLVYSQVVENSEGSSQISLHNMVGGQYLVRISTALQSKVVKVLIR
jgi:endoglucanase